MTSHDIGDDVALSTSITDTADAPVDPTTVDLSVTDPAGTTTTPTVTNDAVGAYSSTVNVDQAGRWRATWTTTGPAGVDHSFFDVNADPPASPDPLATIDDLEARIGTLTATDAARAPGLLRGASAKVRGYCRQDITRVDDDTRILRASGHRIYLPQRPVIDVTAVALVDGATDVTLTGWVWEGLDEIDLRPAMAAEGQPTLRTNSNNYRVTYSHGFNPGGYVIDGVVDVVATMVNRVLTSPTMVDGVTQHAIGQFSQQFQQATGSAGSGVRLYESDKDVLADLGLRSRSGTVRTRAR